MPLPTEEYDYQRRVIARLASRPDAPKFSIEINFLGKTLTSKKAKFSTINVTDHTGFGLFCTFEDPILDPSADKLCLFIFCASFSGLLAKNHTFSGDLINVLGDDGYLTLGAGQIDHPTKGTYINSPQSLKSTLSELESIPVKLSGLLHCAAKDGTKYRLQIDIEGQDYSEDDTDISFT
ncbi:hypothetical protein HU719_010090 [Pseudomonas sp. SWRI107]|uniref:hypothetical protein n=1 Tax=Pseudomonas farsensis TaxID=2745492 RepID=UPI0016491B44|nr:hypothetical protein [Pseudomonas farsensis]MBV4531759.1 hypothetical protein [Pseudomonas farsensis]